LARMKAGNESSKTKKATYTSLPDKLLQYGATALGSSPLPRMGSATMTKQKSFAQSCRVKAEMNWTCGK